MRAIIRALVIAIPSFALVGEATAADLPIKGGSPFAVCVTRAERPRTLLTGFLQHPVAAEAFEFEGGRLIRAAVHIGMQAEAVGTDTALGGSCALWLDRPRAKSFQVSTFWPVRGPRAIR